MAAAPATELASTMTLSADVGTDAPVAPPVEADHVLVAEYKEVVAAGSIAYLSAIIHLLFYRIPSMKQLVPEVNAFLIFDFFENLEYLSILNGSYFFGQLGVCRLCYAIAFLVVVE